MGHIDRPTQITSILKTVYAGTSAEISMELETYIADLEAKQPNRPTRITTILSTISGQYSADMRRSLETYISNLEANQQFVLPGNAQAASQDLDDLPIWSHRRLMMREQRRRERTLRDHNNYQ